MIKENTDQADKAQVFIGYCFLLPPHECSRRENGKISSTPTAAAAIAGGCFALKKDMSIPSPTKLPIAKKIKITPFLQVIPVFLVTTQQKQDSQNQQNC